MSSFKIGDVLTRDQVDGHLGKGAKVYDQSTGKLRVRSHGDGYVFTDHGPTPTESTYVLVELPGDLTDRDTLARKLHDASTGEPHLWGVRAPSVREQYGKKADFVLENFVPKGDPGDPDRVKDGTGDWWYRAKNGKYFYSSLRNPNRDMDWATYTLTEIERDYRGISERIY